MPGFALAFAFHFGTAAPARPDDGWLSADKAKHFLTSAFVQSVSFSALRAAGVSKDGSLIGATIVSAGVGAGKELWDRKFGGDPSWKDLAADGAGILAASLVLRHAR
jgi:putative lipoprotein